MAEVYGNIGDQQVELNNAATEATLTALLAVSKAQYEKQAGGKNTKAYKDLEKNLKSLVKQSQTFNKTLAKSTVEIDKQTQSVREARKAYEQQSASMKKFAAGALKVTTNLLNAAAGVNQLASQISRMGNSMNSATAVLRSIPVVGDALSAGLGAIAGAVESTQKAFIDAASVGANFGGSMESMIDHATNAGLTIDQFSQIIRNNGENLAFLASSTSEGAKRLSLLSSTMRKSGVQDQLAYLGFSLEEINTGMASFSGMLAKGGINIRGMANERLVELTSNYMTNLDAVSKLTGQSRQELEKQRQERQRDSQVRILERRLDVDSRNRLNSTFDIVGPEISKGLNDLFMGYIQSPEAQDLATFQGEAAQLAVQMGESMRRTGNLSTQSVDQLVQSLANGAKKISGSELVNVLGGPLAERYGNFVVANMDLERLRGKSLTDIEKEIQKELAARKASGKDADPAAIMRTQQDLAKASNQATEFLVKQSGILTSALDLMSGALRHTIGYLNKLIDVGREGGFTAVLSEIGNDVFDAMKRAISYLFDSLAAIGERLGKALWNSLPSSLKNWFGSEEEKETTKLANIKQDLEKKIAETQQLIDNPPSGRRAQGIDQTKILADLQRQLAENISKTQARAQAQAGPQSLPPVPQAQQRAGLAQTQATNNNTAATEQQAELARNEAEQARLREQREAARIKELTEAQQANTKATTANTSTVKAASSCELDYSSPQALFNSFAKIMVGGKPGVTDTITGASAAGSGGVPVVGELGSMSAKYESGSAGSMAVGRDKSGGTSYGKYQIASKVGSMNDFLKLLQKNDPEAYARLMSAGPQDAGVDGAFAKEWKKLAGEGKIQKSEREFAVDKIFKPAMKGLKDQDLSKMIEGNKGLQEMMFSMAIQHGPGGAPAILNKVYKKGMSAEQLTEAAYTERGADGGKRYFGSSSENERASVVNRFGREKQDVLALLGQPASRPGVVTPSATPAAVVTPTEAQAAAAVVREPTAGGTTPNTPGAGAVGAGNTAPANTMSSQLETLNTTAGQLVALTSESNNIARQQLSAIKNNSSDLYT